MYIQDNKVYHSGTPPFHNSHLKKLMCLTSYSNNDIKNYYMALYNKENDGFRIIVFYHPILYYLDHTSIRSLSHVSSYTRFHGVLSPILNPIPSFKDSGKVM